MPGPRRQEGVKPERSFQPRTIGGSRGLRPVRDEPQG